MSNDNIVTHYSCDMVQCRVLVQFCGTKNLNIKLKPN